MNQDKKLIFYLFILFLDLKYSKQDASFHISVEGKLNDPIIQKTCSELKSRFSYVEINAEVEEVPWFPRCIKDLELCK